MKVIRCMCRFLFGVDVGADGSQGRFLLGGDINVCASLDIHWPTYQNHSVLDVWLSYLLKANDSKICIPIWALWYTRN